MFLRTAIVGIATALLIGTATVSPVQADQTTGPETPSIVAAVAFSLLQPDADPPGANDWSCRPTAAHPRPVVLVHGTWSNRYNGWARMSPALKRAGYCVFALDYGDSDGSAAGLHPAVKGTGDIRESARELAIFVDQVRAATGASKVDLVGHSQGGMLPRQYLKFEGGQGKVHTLISFAGSHHGTTLDGITILAGQLNLLGLTPIVLGTAARQQVRGSEFITALNEGGDTVPGVAYVVIGTKYDEVVTPYQSTFLTAGPGATVRNVVLQDGCPLDLSDHLSITYSPRSIGLVSQALDPAAGPPPCLPHLPVL